MTSHGLGSDGDPGSDDRGCQPRLPGPLALNNHWWELHRLLEVCLGALDRADPSMQHTLALQQKALLVGREMSVFQRPVQPTSSGRILPLLLTSPTSSTSALEHQCRNKRTHTSKHTDQAPLQNLFANVRWDESLLVSKALRGGRSAKQAAEHIQQCMSTACQKAGAQQQQQPQDHQLLGQLLQHQPLEQMAPTASHVMPQQRLDLLQEYLML
jgi:hypothetical protein